MAVPLKSLITGVVNVLFVSVCVSVSVTALPNLVCSASVKALVLLFASYAVLISAFVWSPVAPVSIPSSLSWCDTVITPAAEPVASPIVALVPSLLLTITVVVVVEVVRLVVTFVFFALLAVMSATIELASLSVVTASFIILSVVTASSTISLVLTEFAARWLASKGELAIRVLISLAVWSAVAFVSIVSNLVPSAATSLPSTVPDTTTLPVTVSAPVAAVPVVDTFCDPNDGVTLVPSIAADAFISLLTIVPFKILALVTLASFIAAVLTACGSKSYDCTNWSCVSFSALRACFVLLFRSSALTEEPAWNVALPATALLPKFITSVWRTTRTTLGLLGAVRLPDVFHVTVPPVVV